MLSQMHMHSADYTVARCLSTRLSVCPSHAGIGAMFQCETPGNLRGWNVRGKLTTVYS